MAETTIVPFSTLPACASSCGPLYDVNGKCVPPATSTAALEVYEQCFCADTRLTAFSTTTAGPCDAACAATPDGFAGITNWYKGMCAGVQPTTANPDGATSTSAGSSSNHSSGGGDWLSTHWQWVIFIVVMVVGIAGIWIGAAVWRRHYLRKKDRQYALGKHLARRTGSGQNPYNGPMDSLPARSGSIRAPTRIASGYPSSHDTSPYGEKPKKKLLGDHSNL